MSNSAENGVGAAQPKWLLSDELRAVTLSAVTSRLPTLPEPIRKRLLRYYPAFCRAGSRSIFEKATLLPPFPVPQRSRDNIYVHIVTSRRDWLMALWSCRTFLTCADAEFPVIFHDDGTLGPAEVQALQSALPGCRVLRREVADQIAKQRLRGYPLSLRLRDFHVLGLKLTDPWLQHDGDVLLLDSDLLFFSRPEELLSWRSSNRSANLFIADIRSAYTLSKQEITAAFGVRVEDRINSGLLAVSRAAIDFSVIETVLSNKKIWSDSWLIEQTIYAVLLSIFGARPLSEKYLVDTSVETGIPEGASCKHYVGPIRGLMSAEGIRHLLRLEHV